MKKLGIAIAAMALLCVAGATPSMADTTTTVTTTPSVATITPFSADCNYMSRAGFLRYLVFDQQGIWLTRQDAVAQVQNQIGGTGD